MPSVASPFPPMGTAGIADPAPGGITTYYYDVTPDGQFVMIEQPEVQAFTQIHLVFNWLEELKRRAGTN